MPNFITKTLQKVTKHLNKISESFNGPRTNDVDYQIKKEKVKKVEKALIKLRSIILNFNTYFESKTKVENRANYIQ